MELRSVIAALGLDDSAEALALNWGSSQQAMPPGELPFLSPSFIKSACEETWISGEVAAAAVAAAARVRQSPELRALAWHFHHCLFGDADYPLDAVGRWPSLEEGLHGQVGPFYLLVLLSGLPRAQGVHRAHQVPSDVARDTLLDLKLWLEVEGESRARGRWALTPRNVGWLANHFRGELYRLGRLQYQFGTFGYRIRAFRHRASRAVVALSEDGITYEADGGRDASPGEAGRGGWTARLVETPTEVIGNPISPRGRALRQEVRFPVVEWELALARGQPVLYMHIPAGGPLAHDLCGESVRAAVEFFPRHFPERPFDAVCCGSWLLNAQIDELLPPDSNIVRFQREFYLFPIPLDPKYLLIRVFGEEPADLRTVARRTSFQRALADHLAAGGRLRPAGGGCFLLPEDLDWGAQVYRRQRLPWQG